MSFFAQSHEDGEPGKWFTFGFNLSSIRLAKQVCNNLLGFMRIVDDDGKCVATRGRECGSKWSRPPEPIQEPLTAVQGVEEEK